MLPYESKHEVHWSLHLKVYVQWRSVNLWADDEEKEIHIFNYGFLWSNCCYICTEVCVCVCMQSQERWDHEVSGFTETDFIQNSMLVFTEWLPPVHKIRPLSDLWWKIRFPVICAVHTEVWVSRALLVLQLAWAKPLGKAKHADTDVLLHWFKSSRHPLSFLGCQEMSDDVSLGVEQKPKRSAEVLAPTPEQLLDHCLCCSTQYPLSWRVNDSCSSAFQTVSCSNQVSTRQYRPVFTAAPHAAYSLDILTHLNRLRPVRLQPLLHCQTDGKLAQNCLLKQNNCFTTSSRV